MLAHLAPVGNSKTVAIPLHLRAWRNYRGLKQDQLAERIGTTAATISRIENARQNWDQAFLQAAADALRCEPVDLLVRDPTDPEGIWSIWENVEPTRRAEAASLLKVIAGGKTGT